MRNLMGRLKPAPTMALLVAVGVVAAVSLTAPSSSAQSRAYRAPRTADGKPNLNGVYQAITEAYWDIEPHSAAPGQILELGASNAVPAGSGIVDAPLPYKPEALAKKKENYANRIKLDPEIKCYLPGVPRAMYMPYPFQIVQTPTYIMMAFTYARGVRTIYMTDHKEAPADSWMGWSNGHWEGETLVIDTAGFNDQSWFDRAGNFHSDQLHVVERITAIDADHLSYEATIDDPQTFTRPWKISMPLYRRVEKNAQLLEFNCIPFVEDLIYGSLRKPSSN
ncbi:MAG TPA: hypothetical protein VL693_22535 [Vicinamibacterales bacterium]|jgi:hypothetical protein|nr:hypothetical protein [Vicinamibacterales bacterium]